jgi:inner membrane protease subunit 2
VKFYLQGWLCKAELTENIHPRIYIHEASTAAHPGLQPSVMASNRIFSLFNRGMLSGQTFRDFLYWPFVFATWIPAAIFFNDNVGNFTWITGASMYPFLNSNFNENLKPTICWMRKWEPTKDLERGMIVTFRYAGSTSTMLIELVLT